MRRGSLAQIIDTPKIKYCSLWFVMFCHAKDSGEAAKFFSLTYLNILRNLIANDQYLNTLLNSVLTII